MCAAPPDGEKTQRPRRSLHGRRKGRPIRAARQRLLDTLLPRLELNLEAAAGDPTGQFVPTPAALWLEIGFGGGEHLAWQAEQNPNVGIIGAEFFINGVGNLLKLVEDANLKNVRIHKGDARDLLDRLPEQTIDRAFILFPDPWPKAKHNKRRIVQKQTLDRLAELLKTGAELRIATDDPSYRRWILAAATDHPWFDWNVEVPGDWRRRSDDWPPTRYEEKALAAGRQPVYLRFTRRAKMREST
ncbi:tRNA (guanosine(46)-N7)-methyltransferase TrmB [Limibacillus sp. MBR-115]|uniref:tRNA (guanosine(46)-N7)-methyltransferase TrmB n=1 Tax=Limibacillus sp. MBR-115 TaxID=3156465 RepID=UPI003395FFE0